MINLLAAIELEAKYLSWLGVSGAARRLAAYNAYDTRSVFVQIWIALNPEYVRNL
jgi:hypothetical protein